MPDRDLPGLPGAKEAAAENRGGFPTLASLFEKARGAGQVARQVMGMPDYDRYLAHAAQQHPDKPVLTRRLFVEQAIDRRYGGLGPRCC